MHMIFPNKSKDKAVIISQSVITLIIDFIYLADPAITGLSPFEYLP